MWPKVAGALAPKGCSMGKPSLSRASIGSTAVDARKGLVGSKMRAAVAAEPLPFSALGLREAEAQARALRRLS